jgi:hypothetical protein
MPVTETFTPKTTKYGDVVWTGFFTDPNARPMKSGGTTYVMVKAGTSGFNRDDSKGIAEVRQNVADGGWDIVLYGSVVANEHYKVDAQRELKSLFL